MHKWEGVQSWARVLTYADLYSCVYAGTVYLHWPGTTNVVVGGKEIRKFWSAFRKHPNDWTIWLSEHFQALEGLRAQFGEFHTCLLSSNLKENGNYSQKKKCYIALWIICVLWTFNLLDSISISNNSTRLLSNNNKKRNVQKQNGLSWNLLYQQGKNSCVIISIIRCLRNYFNHTMFKMTRKLCYKPVCNCDAHHTRLVEHSKIFMPCVGKTPSAKLVHSVCEDS